MNKAQKLLEMCESETQRQKLARLAREAGDTEYADDVLAGRAGKDAKDISRRIAYYTSYAGLATAKDFDGKPLKVNDKVEHSHKDNGTYIVRQIVDSAHIKVQHEMGAMLTDESKYFKKI